MFRRSKKISKVTKNGAKGVEIISEFSEFCNEREQCRRRRNSGLQRLNSLTITPTGEESKTIPISSGAIFFVQGDDVGSRCLGKESPESPGRENQTAVIHFEDNLVTAQVPNTKTIPEQ